MTHRFNARFFYSSQDEELSKKIYAFRKQLFVDHYKWALKSDGIIETDEFDDENAIHCVLMFGETVLGYFRCINSCHPYLANTKFPSLSTKQPYPSRSDCWEVSRFGVLKSHERFGITLYSLMFEFAKLKTATSLVALVDIYHEIYLRRIGVKTKRYGSPLKIGNDLDGEDIIAVAGEIPITEQPETVLQRFKEALCGIDIKDDTYVQRLDSLSA